MTPTSPAHDASAPLPLPAPLAAPRGLATSVARLGELTLLIAAGALLLVSIVLPYWQITLHAPQYPKGLNVLAYAYQLTGDVSEVDGLNHYIGMMKLNDAATIERTIALVALPLIALLTVASFRLRGVWRILARAPIVAFPIVFTLDLFAWLYYAGHSLDPQAPLSSSIKPFTPHILGVGKIGQFSTEAMFQPGFFLAVIAAIIVVGATIARRGTSNAARP